MFLLAVSSVVERKVASSFSSVVSMVANGSFHPLLQTWNSGPSGSVCTVWRDRSDTWPAAAAAAEDSQGVLMSSVVRHSALNHRMRLHNQQALISLFVKWNRLRSLRVRAMLDRA